MGQKERNGLDEPLRNSSLDLGGEVREQRQIFEEMLGACPLAADMTTTATTKENRPPCQFPR